MNFLQRIKEQMIDPRNGRIGSGQLVRVDSIALAELIDHFESIDSQFRAAHDSRDTAENLHNAVTAMYHKRGKNSDEVLLIIMDTLRPLIKEKLKQRAIDARF